MMQTEPQVNFHRWRRPHFVFNFA